MRGISISQQFARNELQKLKSSSPPSTCYSYASATACSGQFNNLKPRERVAPLGTSSVLQQGGGGRVKTRNGKYWKSVAPQLKGQIVARLFALLQRLERGAARERESERGRNYLSLSRTLHGKVGQMWHAVQTFNWMIDGQLCRLST